MNQEKDKPKKFTDKEIFEIALRSRDFEIKMFWQRCNYFLLLNTSVGVAVGVAATSDINRMHLSFIIFCLCIIGAFVCFAWINVGLGAKFWQSYWEQVVADYQEKNGLTAEEEKDFFSQPKHAEHVNQRVKKSLGMPCEAKAAKCAICFGTYEQRVLSKPSVSRWMHKTAFFFFLVWFFAIAYTSFNVPWRTLFTWLPSSL